MATQNPIPDVPRHGGVYERATDGALTLIEGADDHPMKAAPAGTDAQPDSAQIEHDSAAGGAGDDTVTAGEGT